MYVIVSADPDSPFADELYHNEGSQYDVGGDELADLLEPLRPHVLCPVCKPRGRTAAVLAVHEGRRGRFVGCTNFRSGHDHHCGDTERVCERYEQGLMIRLGNGRARCQDVHICTFGPFGPTRTADPVRDPRVARSSVRSVPIP